MAENNFGYEKMLGIGAAHDPSDDELNKLAEFMAIEPKKIPAGYTYLAQFVDHDISLDSAVVSGMPPWNSIPASSISNRRNPSFNLETIYGFEHPSNQGEPRRTELLEKNSRSLLRLGETGKDSVEKTFPNDLPRETGSPKARIVDQRNDENLAVAQTQVAFLKFHNAVVKYLGGENTTETFEAAREIVIQHYQWVILKDLLPRIIKQSVLDDVLAQGNKFYFPEPKNVFMPLEFSVAACRAGHSMVRSSYNWNRIFNDDPSPHALPATLAELMMFTGKRGMNGNERLPSDWLINWNWFYDIDRSRALQKRKFNFASKINTKIAPPLGFLNSHIVTFRREFSLAALHLYRAKSLSLPTGQAVAKMILGTGKRILKPEQIARLLPENLKDTFSKNTPLWFYLLAEAEIEQSGQTMGEVGSRIVAETFIALLKLSRPSILNDDFQPNPDFCGEEGEFGMPQMLKFVAKNNQRFDELNPIRDE